MVEVRDSATPTFDDTPAQKPSSRIDSQRAHRPHLTDRRNNGKNPTHNVRANPDKAEKLLSCCSVSTADPDVIVIGSGPNGLCAACSLAKSGFHVWVLEANKNRPGGALGSAELTLPGFVHDVGAAFFPFGKLSPAFRALGLEKLGVQWLHAEYESCHPALDGSVAAIARRIDNVPFGSVRDGQTWRSLRDFHRSIEQPLLQALLGTFPTIRPLLKLNPLKIWRVARMFAASGRRLSERLFESEGAKRVLPSLGLHVDVGPEDWFGAPLGYILGLSATTGGFPVVRGGARSLTNALITHLERHGGRLRLGARVTQILVQNGRASALKLEDGQEIRARLAIVANTSAPSLFLKLLERRLLPGRIVRKMREFPLGFGTFKVDWALSGPVPWKELIAHRSAVVHAAESVEDLVRFTKVVRNGNLDDKPYLVIGQQSLVDRSRAPNGQHTLYCYSRVPNELPAGWEPHRESYADVIEQRIESLAPGFRTNILARHVACPSDLERDNENLPGGDLGGGSNAWNRQLLFRPVFPYFRHRTPIRGLYLSSSFAHPGAGVHGMCGYNAASAVRKDLA